MPRKWLRLDRVDGTSELDHGSATFTRRQSRHLNWRRIRGLRQLKGVHAGVGQQFDGSWSNPDGGT